MHSEWEHYYQLTILEKPCWDSTKSPTWWRALEQLHIPEIGILGSVWFYFKGAWDSKMSFLAFSYLCIFNVKSSAGHSDLEF